MRGGYRQSLTGGAKRGGGGDERPGHRCGDNEADDEAVMLRSGALERPANVTDIRRAEDDEQRRDERKRHSDSRCKIQDANLPCVAFGILHFES
jgi:hypothetical protein